MLTFLNITNTKLLSHPRDRGKKHDSMTKLKSESPTLRFRFSEFVFRRYIWQRFEALLTAPAPFPRSVHSVLASRPDRSLRRRVAHHPRSASSRHQFQSVEPIVEVIYRVKTQCLRRDSKR